MTVAELVKLLLQQKQDAEVFVIVRGIFHEPAGISVTSDGSVMIEDPE